MTSAPKRLWFPEDLLDEDLPPGRDSAEAWLALPQGLGPEDVDEEDRWMLENYRPGDILRFKWMEARGVVMLRIRRDGTLHTPLRCSQTADMFSDPQPETDIPDPHPPANHWWNDDHEAFGNTAEEFAEAMSHCAEWNEDGFAEVEAETYYWSDVIRFRLGQDGKSLAEVNEDDAETRP